MLYRNFGYLHSRVLLDLQWDLSELEAELERWDFEEELRQGHDSCDEEDINIGERSRNDLGRRTRRRILDDIQNKLEEYGS